MNPGEIRVLHVENDAEFAELTSTFLGRAGISVVTEPNPEVALSRLEDGSFDAVVSDYRMPEMTGLDLLEAVKERYPALPFVLFTGEGNERIASDAIAAGIDEYVEKRAGTEHFDLLINRLESAVDRARTQAKLARTQDRYERLLETAPTPIAIYDADAIQFINDACLDFLGVDDPEQVLGMDPLTFFNSEESAMARERMQKVLAAREPVEAVEYTLQTPNDGERHVVLQTSPVEYGGKPAGQVVINDVTEYREAQAELEQEKRTLETALDAVDDLFFILDPEGRPVRWNERVNRVSGYDDDELRAMSMAEFFAEEQADEVRAGIERMLDEGSATVEAEVLTADGERVPFEFRGVRITDDSGAVVGGCGIGRDVGAQRAYERELEQYRALIETMGDPMYVVDEMANLTEVNQALVDKSGFSREELLGSNVSQFMDAEDVQAVTELVWEILTSEDRSSGTVEFEVSDGKGNRRIVEDSVSVLTDDDGNYVCTVGVLHDVTEERMRKQQLRRQNERLDRFAALVSHDLRNPINVIQGFVDLAEETGDPEHFERIRDAASRMESLVEDMLMLARHGAVVNDRQAVDLAEAARRAWDSVDTKEGTLTVEGSRTLQADPERLSALFENLYRNSVEHVGDDVSVTVVTTAKGFAVFDDGPGLPEDRRQLFDYGVSHDGGTGLGLAIVEEICEAHGWSVSATDAENGGARFDISF